MKFLAFLSAFPLWNYSSRAFCNCNALKSKKHLHNWLKLPPAAACQGITGITSILAATKATLFFANNEFVFRGEFVNDLRHDMFSEINGVSRMTTTMVLFPEVLFTQHMMHLLPKNFFSKSSQFITLHR